MTYSTPRLNALAEMEDGWDSYRSLAPTEMALRVADSLIWVPRNDGGVELTGVVFGAEVGIGITADGHIESVTYFSAPVSASPVSAGLDE